MKRRKRLLSQAVGNSARLRYLAERILAREDGVGPFTREAFERHQRVFAERAAEREAQNTDTKGSV